MFLLLFILTQKTALILRWSKFQQASKAEIRWLQNTKNHQASTNQTAHQDSNKHAKHHSNAREKKSKQTPGASRDEQTGEPRCWYYTVCHHRRPLKPGPTRFAQDIGSCYKATTPRIYVPNLALKEEKRPGLNRLGYRLVCTTK
jgi:hypothetical protein